jgi:hypothetical protein
MRMFKKIIELLNRMKNIDIWGDKNEGISNEEIDYINSLPKQNPYGMPGLIFAVLAFLFPEYGLSFITLTFCVITFFTFDKEKEDNQFPFVFGILFSLIGLFMFLTGEIHRLII